MRERILQYADPWIDDDDIEEVIKTLKKGYISSLPKVKEFEINLADYVDTKYAVAFSNGTAALHACAFLSGIKNGDEVITTPITFAASSNCILYCGGKPVFADIKEDTYNIDPDSIEKNITKKTKAIIPVHYTGQPADIDAIYEIANDHNLIIFEDAAHALGALYKNRKIGSISKMNVFSFHPVKHITTGEGGAVTTNDEYTYKKLLQFRMHGIVKVQHKEKKYGMWFNDQQFLGYNYKFTDLQAALGVSQLKKIDKFLSIRKKYVDMYNDAFDDMKNMAIPYQLPYVKSSWHLYILKLDTKKIGKSRNQIYDELRIKHNIGVAIHYTPVYHHTYYQNIGYKKGICPVSEKFSEDIITIPLFPKMTEDDVNNVIDAVKKVCE